jgi:hypothetical protein
MSRSAGRNRRGSKAESGGAADHSQTMRTEPLQRRPVLFIAMLCLFALWVGFLLAMRLTQVAPSR